MLSKVVCENQRDWDSQFPKVLLAYQTSIHESTGYMPFLVNYGHSVTLPVDVMLQRASMSLAGGKGLMWSKLGSLLNRHMINSIVALMKHIKPIKRNMTKESQDATLQLEI